MDELSRLSNLIEERNRVKNKMTAIIGQAAQLRYVGDYIAAAIFDLTLHPVGSKNRIGDGYFTAGPLAGQSVEVKWHSREEYELDIDTAALPDYYLVFNGPRVSTDESRRSLHQWAIGRVHLFQTSALLDTLPQRTHKAKEPVSAGKAQWDDAELYPTPHNTLLALTDAQRAQLSLFAPDRLIPTTPAKTSSYNGHRAASAEPAQSNRSEDAAPILLAHYRFTVDLLPEEDGAFTLWVPELGVGESGKTIREVRQALVEAVRAYIWQYQGRYGAWKDIPEKREQLPYVLRAFLARDDQDLLTMLLESVPRPDATPESAGA